VSKVRIGTRASRLARAQTEQFGEALRGAHPGLEIEYVNVTTDGDMTTTPLWESPVPGVFVSRLRDELLASRVDVVVHSMKDLPAAHCPGLSTVCVPPRVDPRDVVVSRNGLALSALAPGSRVGTSSPRRTATLRRHRNDLRVESIRGNIDSRIAKVLSGEYDATVLALAGLIRADLTDAITEYLSTDMSLPAPRQGALAIEARDDDLQVATLCQSLEDPVSRLTSEAERSLLVGLNAGCSTAIGGLASWSDNTLTLVAELALADTGEALRLEGQATARLDDLDAATALGNELASALMGHDIYERASFS